MALKQDRPTDEGLDGVVVYMAKSEAEVDRVRAAFAEAEIPVELPEAAVAALFAAGRDALPVRVRARDFSRALDVVDRVFPRGEPAPLELALPASPEPAAGPAAGPDPGAPAVAGDAGVGDSPAAAPAAVDPDDELWSRRGGDGPHLEHMSFEPATDRGDWIKRADDTGTRATKLLIIAAGSPVLPLVGLGFALFAVWASARALLSGARLYRTWISLAIGVASTAFHLVVIAFFREHLPGL